MQGGKKDKKDNENKLQFEMKVYSTPYKNSKGKHIGKVSHHVKGTLPYTSIDQTDHFLSNLYNYVTSESIRNYEFAQKKLESEGKEFINEFYPHFKKTVDFYPMSQDLVKQGSINKNALTATIDTKDVYLHRKKGGAKKTIRRKGKKSKKHNKTSKSKK